MSHLNSKMYICQRGTNEYIYVCTKRYITCKNVTQSNARKDVCDAIKDIYIFCSVYMYVNIIKFTNPLIYKCMYIYRC